MRIIHLEDKLFHFHFNLVVGATYDQFKTVVNDHAQVQLEDYSDTNKGMFLAIPDKDWYFFWVADAKDTLCIMHECVHLVACICRTKGITLSKDSEEVFAHMLEYWYSTILEHIKPTKSKR